MRGDLAASHALHLRGDVKGLFFEWLREHRPDLLPDYQRLYQRGAYAPAQERHRLASLLKGPDLPPGQRMRGTPAPPAAREPQVHRRLEQERLF